MQDRNVSDSIYPPEDYRGYEQQGVQGDLELATTPEGPPKLYVDALPVKPILADRTYLYTIAIQAPAVVAAGTIYKPVKLVDKSPNNLRRRVLIVSNSNDAALTHTPDQIMLLTMGTTLGFANAFHLETAMLFECTSAGDIYAVARGAANAWSYVSVMIDEYLPDHS
jgi:hypothetical protein